MEIQKTSALLVTTSDPKSLSRLLSQLKPGYSLDAVVEAKLAENSFVLKLSGGQSLRAQTPNVLELGQILKLEVVKAGTVPELKIIVPERVVQPEQSVVIQALRQFLPKQQGLADFAVFLRQIATLTTGKSDAVSAAIHETLGALLSKNELMSAEGLKRGISNSGVFLEAKLANLPLILQGDLKGHLLTLADALQKAQGNQNTLSSAETINLATGKEAEADSAPAKTLSDALAGVIDKALFNKNTSGFLEAKLANLPLTLQGDLKRHLLILADTLQKVQGIQNTLSSAETIHPATGQTADSLPAKTLLDVLAGALDKALFNKNPSGFLEAKLANLPLTLQGDLKRHLLTLADTLQKVQGIQNTLSGAETIHPATGQAADSSPAKILLDVLAGAMDEALLNKTEGAIARIALDQLASLPQNDDKQNTWQIEIPFIDGHHTDSVKLKINRESNANQSSDQANWSVVLELNPPGLGKLHSRISLVGDRIDTYFWSDQKTTTALVREHLDRLSARYTQVGLSVGQLNALEGTPVHTKSSDPPLLRTLLDERV